MTGAAETSSAALRYLAAAFTLDCRIRRIASPGNAQQLYSNMGTKNVLS
jgi:hypothetical protein